MQAISAGVLWSIGWLVALEGVHERRMLHLRGTDRANYAEILENNALWLE